MGNTTTASVTGAQVAPAKSAIKDLPIAKVWAFAVGQFGWALLSGIISNWLVYFYQPDQETISQGQTVFVPQGLVVLGIVTVVGGITAFARFFDAFVDPAVASLSDRCDAKSGRRMPFLKFAALPLAVVTVLVFWSPINGTSWVNAAFLFVTVIGYYIALTFYCTPYNALIAELGHDSKQQLTISTAISFTWVAGTAIAYVAPVIWGAFVPMMGRITAIRVTFTIMAAVAFVCMLVPPLAIREKDYVNSHPTSESTIESLKQTFGDGEFRKFVCSDGFIPAMAQGLVLSVVGAIPMAAFGILPQAIVANIADASSKTTGQDRQGMFYAARTFAMKMGQSVAMLLFTGVSTIGMASGAGYRIAAVCAAVLCGLGGIVFAFYNEKKVLGVLET